MSKATEMVLYRTCKRMIERGSTDGLAEKIDIFYVPLENLYLSPQCGFASCEIGNKLTEDEYTELTALLAEKTEKKEQV